MAKIVNGILGGISGKVAGVVGGSWKGINYIRAYTVPANPNTTAQQAQRTKFSAVRSMASALLASVLQPYWDPFQSGMSGYNAFMSVNLSAWSDETYNATTGDVGITFSNSIMGNGLASDSAVMMIYDAENNVMFSSTDTRDDGGSVSGLNIGAGRTLAELHAFLFFYRGTGDSLTVSNSDYSAVSAE